MSLVSIAAILLLVTGGCHLYIPIRYGRNSGTTGIAVFGVIYLVFGILIFALSANWIPITAAILATIGAIGAFATRNDMPEILSWTWFFIIIDILIVGFIAIEFLF